MLKQSNSRYIKNPLYDSEQNDYIKSRKIKGTVKLKPQKQTLKDITNTEIKLTQKKNSIQKIVQQLPKKINLQIYDDSEESLQQDRASECQISDEENIIQKKEQQIQDQYQNQDLQQKSNDDIKIQAINRRIFNFEFEDSDDDNADNNIPQNQGDNNIPQNQGDDNILQNQGDDNIPQNQADDQFEQRKEQQGYKIEQKNTKAPKNIKNLLLICSDSQNSEKFQKEMQIQQRKEQIFQKDKVLQYQNDQNIFKGKKFLFDQQDLSQTEKQSQQQSKSQSQKQVLQVLKKINIHKIKSSNPYFNLNQTVSLYQKYSHLLTLRIPQGSVYSMMIKRNSDQSQYMSYDDQLVRHVIGVKKKGGVYRFYVRQREQCVSSKIGKKIQKRKQIQVEIARMSTNFLGTQFHCYYLDKNEKSKEKKYFISIKYQTNILGLNGPRKISLYIPTTESIAYKDKTLIQIYDQAPIKKDSGILKYINKTPKWSDDLNAYVLDFKGRATRSSVKNCIIVDEQMQQEFLVFGKVSKDIFNLDIKYKMTIIQGIALAVSSFQKKLGCQ